MRKLTALLIISIFLFTPLLALANGKTTLPNPIQCDNILCLFIGVIRVFLGAVAVFALFIFIYGGFLMLTSQGNPEAIKKSKDTLLWATLGIIVILGSWAFISYILETLISSTNS